MEATMEQTNPPQDAVPPNHKAEPKRYACAITGRQRPKKDLIRLPPPRPAPARRASESIANQDTIAENTEDDFLEHRTLGQRLSDRLASFGGSWTFLLSFFVFLVIWMAINIAIGE